MFKNLIIAFATVSLIFSCGGTTPSVNEENHETATTESKQDGKHFGETISQNGAITYGEMLTKLSNADSIPAKVVGQVNGVCQAKGCWMTIASESGGEDMMVQFKDYGFFMPKDISGRKVVMQGYAFKALTPVDELKHYAGDEGKSKEEIEAITEPKEEIKFLASGVLLLDN
jgi:Domain of unknown function (DUF4920)